MVRQPGESAVGTTDGMEGWPPSGRTYKNEDEAMGADANETTFTSPSP